jgi:hypothetical protein
MQGVFGPTVWAQLTSSGASAGTLAVARRRGAPGFTDSEVDMVLLFARTSA